MLCALADFPLHHLISVAIEAQKHLAMKAWHWVEEYRYTALFGLLFASGMGLPLPEDVPLIASGVLIAKGAMTWAVAAPVAWVAMMFGDSSLYIIGFLLGWKVVHLPLLGRHLSAKRLKKCEGWFDRWGIWAVGIGRMFAGIRTAIVVTAGSMHFAYHKLIVADGIAAIVSGGAFMVLGYYAGQHAGQVREIVEQYRPFFTVAAIAAALILIPVLWLQSKRRAARGRAEKAVAASVKSA